MKKCDLCQSEVDTLFTLDSKYRVHNPATKKWTIDICEECNSRITGLAGSVDKMVAITMKKVIDEAKRNWVRNLVIKIFKKDRMDASITEDNAKLAKLFMDHSSGETAHHSIIHKMRMDFNELEKKAVAHLNSLKNTWD